MTVNVLATRKLSYFLLTCKAIRMQSMRALALTLLFASTTSLAQTQSAAVEYYVQPDYTGANSLTVTADGLSLSNELAGTTLTFNTGGFFAREFVSQSPIEFSAEIDVQVPDFADPIPALETSLPITAGTFRFITSDGETIEGEIGAQSRIDLIPYSPAPRVLFYEMTLVPSSTTVIPAQSAQLSMDEIKTWGIVVTNGVSFEGAFGYGQNHQYKGGVTF